MKTAPELRSERFSRPIIPSFTWVAVENELSASSSTEFMAPTHLAKTIVAPTSSSVIMRLDVSHASDNLQESAPRTPTMFQAEPKPYVFVTQTEFAGMPDVSGSKKEKPTEVTPLLTKQDRESWWVFLLQVFPPFLLAGFGMVGAGLLLDYVKHWHVFVNLPQLYILVPALLGLKGNLEMTLASRLSTVANMGKLDSCNEQLRLASGNLALLQCQACIVGFLASGYAVLTDLVSGSKFDSLHALLLCTSSMMTASLASLVLGSLMIVVVILSKKLNINPDNVTIPIAASLGDLTTLGLLAIISKYLFLLLDNYWWVPLVIVLSMALLLPAWFLIAHRNEYTKKVLFNGWTPIISAMIISSLGGNILDVAMKRFQGIAVFQPVMNGVGGNLVAVQASRMSTYFHIRTPLGTLLDENQKLSLNPLRAFFGRTDNCRTAVLLMLLVIPGHMIFITIISLFKNGNVLMPAEFIAIYNLVALIQVGLLLYLAHIMIHMMWKRSVDPDNAAIPYLTALGDLLGTGLLTAAFFILELLNVSGSVLFN